MPNILIAGAGNIGVLVADLLLATEDYHVCLLDISLDGIEVKRLRQMDSPHLTTVAVDVADAAQLRQALQDKPFDAVISSLPYFLNHNIARLALELSWHYFDLTEDVAVTQLIKQLAANARTAFVPQCGLAPGFINLVAHDLMTQFDQIERVHMRVGALPLQCNNALQYAFTWSIDGVINEYNNPCQAVAQGQLVTVAPLADLETITLDGVTYEAFNTSGGLGSLAELYAGNVQQMNYKSIRYPGHCDKMRFLMHDLNLNQDRANLKRILEQAAPTTSQDVVVIYVAVTGLQQQQLITKTYTNKVYPREISGYQWSAIQVSTAAAITATMDMLLSANKMPCGLVYQEQMSLQAFLDNRFGQYYRGES